MIQMMITYERICFQMLETGRSGSTWKVKNFITIIERTIYTGAMAITIRTTPF